MRNPLAEILDSLFTPRKVTITGGKYRGQRGVVVKAGWFWTKVKLESHNEITVWNWRVMYL